MVGLVWVDGGNNSNIHILYTGISFWIERKLIGVGYGKRKEESKQKWLERKRSICSFDLWRDTVSNYDRFHNSPGNAILSEPGPDTIHNSRFINTMFYWCFGSQRNNRYSQL